VLVDVLGGLIDVVGSSAETILSSGREGQQMRLFPPHAVPNKKTCFRRTDIPDHDPRPPADASEDEGGICAPYAVQRIIIYIMSL